MKERSKKMKVSEVKESKKMKLNLESNQRQTTWVVFTKD